MELREFLSELENTGALRRFTQPVSPQFEIASIIAQS